MTHWAMSIRKLIAYLCHKNITLIRINIIILAFYSGISVLPANAVGDSVPRDTAMQKGTQANHPTSDGDGTVAGIEMVTVPAGSYQMGSDGGFHDEKPVHIVYVKSFKIGKYEVTQSQWVSVMGKNPSHFKGSNKPVEFVSWHDVQVFIDQLNIQTGQKFRLPSEAEWEYAARAGTNSKWSWGDNENAAGNYAWYANNADSQSHAVGRKHANHFGLYDMHGNVNEWVQDCWNPGYRGAPINGEAWESGSCMQRVFRGASWLNNATLMRSANRGWNKIDNRFSFVGLRLAQDIR